MIVGKGTLKPGFNHELIGTFKLVQRKHGIILITSENFLFDGSPAPGWALHTKIPLSANDPDVVDSAMSTDFQRIASKVEPVTGQQLAVIPPSIDLSKFNTLFLWFYEVPFILGIGQIEKP